MPKTRPYSRRNPEGHARDVVDRSINGEDLPWRHVDGAADKAKNAVVEAAERYLSGPKRSTPKPKKDLKAKGG